jgi:hypothetical protein
VTLRVCAQDVQARTANNHAKAAGSAAFFAYPFRIDFRARMFAQNRDRQDRRKAIGFGRDPRA